MSDSAVRSLAAPAAGVPFRMVIAGFSWLLRRISDEMRHATARHMAAAIAALNHPGVMADFERAKSLAVRAPRK